LAFGVHDSEIELGGDVALIGGAPKPFRGFRVILPYAAAVVKHQRDGRWARASPSSASDATAASLLRSCLLIGGASGIDILDRGEAQRVGRIGDGVLERRAVVAEREAQSENDNRDTACVGVPQMQSMPRQPLAIVKLRLQLRNALLQGSGLGAVAPRSE